MLSALLRAGRSLTAGLCGLSTADSILMSYRHGLLHSCLHFILSPHDILRPNDAPVSVRGCRGVKFAFRYPSHRARLMATVRPNTVSRATSKMIEESIIR